LAAVTAAAGGLLSSLEEHPVQAMAVAKATP
jgi:hypothetical protein